jgi:hypothetical protein
VQIGETVDPFCGFQSQGLAEGLARSIATARAELGDPIEDKRADSLRRGGDHTRVQCAEQQPPSRIRVQVVELDAGFGNESAHLRLRPKSARGADGVRCEGDAQEDDAAR